MSLLYLRITGALLILGTDRDRASDGGAHGFDQNPTLVTLIRGFTIDTIDARLKKSGDLWAAMRTHKGADLLAAIDKLGGKLKVES